MNPLLLFVPVLQLCLAVPGILSRAHSHNDYEQRKPLADALECGFSSVEADIHLVDGQLLVAHDRSEVKPGQTLAALYLDPLQERVHLHGGTVHPGGGEFTLWIDIKSEAGPAWSVLEPLLEQYRGMLTEYRDGTVSRKAVTVVLSGSRPVDALAAATRRLAFLDGRAPDLDADPPATLVPWISESWEKHFRWRGAGPVPDEDRRALDEFVRRAHTQHRRVRFWATGELPAMRELLHSAGVDLIGTDQPKSLREFLLGKEIPQPE